MVLEPGLDLHDWETRWQQLQDLAADSPSEVLPEIVRLAEQMLTERGYALEPPAADSEDPDLVRNFLAARDVALAVDAGSADPGDVAAALENLTEVHDFLVEGRAPP
jgi:hypothetical protein